MATILKKAPYILLLVLLILLSIYFYRAIISLFPAYIHAWTQSDRFALALGFLDNGLNFFQPQTFNLATKHGITGVDFPIHEYIIAILMKISGTKSPLVFRLYTLLYSFAGYVFLYKLSKEITGCSLKSIAVTIFTFTCPIITYYQAGFIPSATALSSAWIGLYFYVHSISANKFKFFIIGILFLTLAALTRAPFNIFLFATLVQQLAISVCRKKFNSKQLSVYAFCYACIILYNLYKHYLNVHYGTQFLTTLLPAANLKELIQVLNKIKETWTFQLFTIYHYIFLAGTFLLAAIAIIINKKKQEAVQAIACFTMLSFVGAVIYFLLMAKQFIDHEYYFMDSFYISIILFFVAGLSFFPMEKFYQKVLFSVVSILLLTGCIYHSKKIQNIKYAETLWDRGEMTRKNFTGAASLMETLKIPRNAKILVLDAYSTNAPLILLNRKGYTTLSTSRKSTAEALKLNFDYIVTQDQFFSSDVLFGYPELQEQLQRIGGNGKISVYKLLKKSSFTSLEDLLGISQPVKTSMLSFNHTSEWKNNYQDSLNNHLAGHVKASDEFGPTFETTLQENTFNHLLVKGRYYSTRPEAKFALVGSLSKDEKTLYYFEFPLSIVNKHEWTPFQCVYLLPDIIVKDAVLKFYIWNTEKNELYYSAVEATLYNQ